MGMDLIKSIRPHNLIPAAAAGLQNLDLTVYLAKQLLASDNKKFHELMNFVPNAKPEDWLKVTAGQRVQIMKKDPKKVGILQVGLDVLAKCFAGGTMNRWTPQIQKMIESYGP